jgi:hypothetical protein
MWDPLSPSSYFTYFQPYTSLHLFIFDPLINWKRPYMLSIQACPATVDIYLGSSFIRPSREQVITASPSTTVLILPITILQTCQDPAKSSCNCWPWSQNHNFASLTYSCETLLSNSIVSVNLGQDSFIIECQYNELCHNLFMRRSGQAASESDNECFQPSVDRERLEKTLFDKWGCLIVPETRSFV